MLILEVKPQVTDMITKVQVWKAEICSIIIFSYLNNKIFIISIKNMIIFYGSDGRITIIGKCTKMLALEDQYRSIATYVLIYVIV